MFRTLLLAAAAAATAAAKSDEPCAGQRGLLSNPSDPAAPGPYPVSSYLFEGTFTERNLTVEAWFPALPGTEVGAANLTIDIRDFLSAESAAKVPAADVPHPLYLGAYADLAPAWQAPSSSLRGLPLIVFVHGTAGWRSPVYS